MEQFAYKVKNNVELENKPRVYFTCHPADFARSFEKISEDILKTHDCIIYYTPDMTAAIPEEDKQTTLERMNLFVIPVTFRLLREPNRAMDEYFPWAQEKKIPVLPIVMEPGLDEFYSQADKFGALQYLDAYAHDATAIRYEEKLEKYLQSVLVDEETAQRIRAAFDAYIFLSYRKKDRTHANELMRMIHRNPLCRDIAIWYDEFLTPGREFTEDIQKALEKSELFALLVTQNLLEPGNYVQRVEYPEAVRAGKEILPVDMEQIGDERLQAAFGNVPVSVDGGQEDEFQTRLLETVRRLGLSKDTRDPAHNYLIGLAYLNGIDVEADRARAVELIESAAEAELPEAMEKLADMYRDAVGVERDYREAVKWAKRMAQWCATHYGEHPATFQALHNLADVYEKAGDYEQGAQWNEKVYELRCKLLGEDHPDTLASLNDLAVACTQLGQWRKAAELLERAYSIGCKVWGPSHPDTLAVLNNLASLYGQQGDSQKEVQLHEKVYELRCEVLGEEHPDTIASLNNLAVAYGKVGDHQKAEQLGTRAYALFCRTQGEEHPDALAALSNLAATCGQLGDGSRELALAEKAYVLRCRVLGEEHPDTVDSLSNLAAAYGRAEDWEKAAETQERALSLCNALRGPIHPNALVQLANLAVACRHLASGERKLALLETLYLYHSAAFGPEHLKTLAALGELSVFCLNAGELEKAEVYGERMYSLCGKVQGPAAENTLAALNNLAVVYGKQEKWEKALETWEKLYALRCRTLGEDHPETAETLDRLAAARERVQTHGGPAPTSGQKSKAAASDPEETLLESIAALYEQMKGGK